MSAGPTAARVYEDLRALLLRGAVRPGGHLDPAVIAPQLVSSTTPVREALNRLVGEGLVETRQGSGFSLPLVDVVSLKDVLCWAGDIARVALRGSRPLSREGSPSTGDHAGRSAAVFAAIARGSGNTEHLDAMQRCNDRLHAIRTVELDVLGDAGEELLALEGALIQGDRRGIRHLVNAYVRRRCMRASQLIRRRYHD